MSGNEPVAGEPGSVPSGEPKAGGRAATVAPPTGTAWRRAFGGIREQLGLRGMISEYMIPVVINTFWYTLGGVLAIALLLEIATGMLLALRYIPDAGQAYQITAKLLDEGGWSVVLNFHYWTAYVIFGLVMIHMLRVFFSGGYRGPRRGLWQIGVGLDGTVQYTHPDLLIIVKAIRLLIPYYALHVAILPILLLGLIAMHYYLIKVKGISLPFWHRPTGRTAPFSEHVRAWLG